MTAKRKPDCGAKREPCPMALEMAFAHWWPAMGWWMCDLCGKGGPVEPPPAPAKGNIHVDSRRHQLRPEPESR